MHLTPAIQCDDASALAFGKYVSCYLNVIFLFTIWSDTIRHPSQHMLVILMRGIFKNTNEILMLICAFEYPLPCSCVVISVIILGHTGNG